MGLGFPWASLAEKNLITSPEGEAEVVAHMPPGAPIGPRHALVSLPKSNSDVRLHCVPPSHLSRKQLLVRANTIINVEAGRPDDIANPADFLLERYQVRAIANLRW